MKKVKVCAIISNKAGGLLMQRRGEDPEINKWVIFGGGVENGETEEQALRREIKEELGYDLRGIRFFGRYRDNGIEQAIFVADDPVESDGLKLNEGLGMEFFSVLDLQSLAIGFNFKQIIDDYLSQKIMEDQKIDKIEKLDYYAIKAAESLPKWKYPELKIERSSRNVFVGSGDADNTGRILAQNFGGHGFSVVDYEFFFKNNPEKDLDVYIVNASGAKDGMRMAKWLTENGWQPKLLTSNPEPPNGIYLKPENIFVYPAIMEPPTYNVSTYAAMLYAILGENVDGLLDKMKNLPVPDLRKYKFIFFLTDDKYEIVGRMSKRKVAETLAGIGADAGGYSNAAHGMLLQPNPDRLVFCMNCKWEGDGDVYELNGNSYLDLLLCAHYIIGKNQTDQDSENILRNYFENAKKQGWKFNKVW
jgi:8-oxo-dGTP pyrophosphatase MutT (NUDIX family)